MENDLFKDKFEVETKVRNWKGELESCKEGDGSIAVTILNRKIIEASKNCHGTWLPIIESILCFLYVLFVAVVIFKILMNQD